MEIADLFQRSTVLPVVVIEHNDDAIPLAEALLHGGINVIEITLRSAAALDAIKTIAEQVPDMLVGAGTVLQPLQFQQIQQAGAQFAISPGFTPALAEASKSAALPYLPAAITPSEIIGALNHGFEILKFFPAELAGGMACLKTLHAVFPQIKFCPTGGISAATMSDYLALDNVIGIGGSWIAPTSLIAEKNWTAIRDLAKQAVNSMAKAR